MRAFVRRHSLASFVILAYALTWIDWIPLAVRDARVTPGGSVTHFPGLLGPAIAALIVTALAGGVPGVGSLLRRLVQVSRPSARFLCYSLSPLAFLALAVVVALLARHPVPPVRDFGVYSGLPALPLLAVLTLILLFSGFGEETGWRGFALERFQARLGPVKGALVLGVVWAGWHVPAFWFVESYQGMDLPTLLGGFGLGICAGSVVLARVANRTDGSVLAAALWHATYNLSSATAAGRGIVPAVTTTCVMIWAGVLLWQEWRSPLPRSRLSVMADS